MAYKQDEVDTHPYLTYAASKDAVVTVEKEPDNSGSDSGNGNDENQPQG